MYYTIPQYIKVYHSISKYTQYITVYHSIPQYIKVYHSISQYTTGISQYTTVYHSIPQYIIVYHRISQYTAVYHHLLCSIPQYIYSTLYAQL